MLCQTVQVCLLHRVMKTKFLQMIKDPNNIQWMNFQYDIIVAQSCIGVHSTVLFTVFIIFHLKYLSNHIYTP